MYTNAWMSVREDAVVRADGSPGIYAVVDKPTYALVIALREEQLHLVEQYRYPVQARRWEFPQGTAPDRADFDPQRLAARELREETGLLADNFHPTGSPGRSSWHEQPARARLSGHRATRGATAA
jgi:8-oxo-dGTP pyrophosphatase MutT (NUDIX family)